MNENSVLSVSQLTSSIKAILESRFTSVHVQGEVTNITYQSSGHVYFSLKDAGAQLSCVLFKGNAQKLSFRPKAGDKVEVSGDISVYPPRGNYQLIARSMKQAGVGNLLLQLHELKKKLQEKGYFEKTHKKDLPKYPKKIGVITSPTGAVIQDIINVIRRRHASFHILLYPVKVQGDGAAREIAQAIYEASHHGIADVLIVGRGGGSLEDLWAFNEEIVADALFNCSIPTIAAVGHETDFSITDFVADLRAPTPSAAAEIVMKETAHQLDFLQNTEQKLAHILSSKIRHLKVRLEKYTAHPLLRSPYGLLKVHMQKLDEISYRLKNAMNQRLETTRLTLTRFEKQLDGHNPRQKLSGYRKSIHDVMHMITRGMKARFEMKKKDFTSLLAHLQAIDPKNLLQKGYCISFDEKSGSVIMGAAQVREGSRVKILYHDGEVSTITEKTKLYDEATRS